MDTVLQKMAVTSKFLEFFFLRLSQRTCPKKSTNVEYVFCYLRREFQKADDPGACYYIISVTGNKTIKHFI